MLGSLNYRKTSGWIRSSGGDFDWRQDINFNGGYHYPNTMFWTQLSNPDYATGAVNTSWRSSEFDDTGLGALFDIDLFKNTNILIGGRYDTSDATRDRHAELQPEHRRISRRRRDLPQPGARLSRRVHHDADDGRGHGLGRLVEREHLAADRRPLAAVRHDGRTRACSCRRTTTRSRWPSSGRATSARPSSRRSASKRASSAKRCNGRARPTSKRASTSAIPRIRPRAPTCRAPSRRGVETEIRWVPNRDFFLSMYVLNQYLGVHRGLQRVDQPDGAPDGLHGRPRSGDRRGALSGRSVLLRRQSQRQLADQQNGVPRANRQPGNASRQSTRATRSRTVSASCSARTGSPKCGRTEDARR